MPMFRDLKVGDTFDFVGPDPLLNSFHSRCTKVSERAYEWNYNLEGRKLRSRVGSSRVQVYHVNELEG